MNKKPHQDKNFKILRSVIIWLYDDRCYVKGCNQTRVEVHHIDKINTNNTLMNLMPLCSECHILVHMMSIKFPEVRKTHVIKLLQKIADIF